MAVALLLLLAVDLLRLLPVTLLRLTVPLLSLLSVGLWFLLVSSTSVATLLLLLRCTLRVLVVLLASDRVLTSMGCEVEGRTSESVVHQTTFPSPSSPIPARRGGSTSIGAISAALVALLGLSKRDIGQCSISPIESERAPENRRSTHPHRC